MKNVFKILFTLLLIVTVLLSLVSCDLLGGFDRPEGEGGASDDGENPPDGGKEENPDKDDGENPDKDDGEKPDGEKEENPDLGEPGGEGEEDKKDPPTISSGLITEKGEIVLKLSDGSEKKLATLSYTDGGTINISYDPSLMAQYGIEGFESLGEGGVALKIGTETLVLEGKLVCPHSFSEWVAVFADCTERRLARSCPRCGEKEYKTEAYDGHQRIFHPAKAATCEAGGHKEYYTCKNCDLNTYEAVKALDHTPMTDHGYPATETEYGLTDGEHCSVCKTVLVRQQIILPTGAISLDKYSSDYGFDYLATLSGGEDMQDFYLAMDQVFDLFHTSRESLDGQELCEFTLSDYGVTLAEAVAVYKCYKLDNPLYYWLSPSFSYNDRTISFMVDEEYLSYDVREEYNKAVYSAVKEYLDKAKSFTDAYDVALAFHDEIIRNISYSYEIDGVTPSGEASAHNILGAFVFGEGVCESYAEAFSMLLNLRGIENVTVSGSAHGEGHAWNLVRLEDGEYYWYDLTWDDTPGYMGGISYNYLAVDDTTPIGRSDYGWISGSSEAFLSSHTLSTDRIGATVESALEFEYSLPERADAPMPLSRLRTVFSSDGLEYVRYNYDRAQVIGIGGEEVLIPETVSFMGVVYTVYAIGGIDAGGLMSLDSIGEDVEKIFIPKTVEYICDGALGISTLASITVDSDNRIFCTLDGVLYTKDMKTLVKYPEAKSGESFVTVDEVLYVAYGGLVRVVSLSKIYIGKNLRVLGVATLGYAYPDGTETSLEDFVDINPHELNNIKAYGAVVYINEENPYLNQPL